VIMSMRTMTDLSKRILHLIKQPIRRGYGLLSKQPQYMCG
jgi:hypothetical protein